MKKYILPFMSIAMLMAMASCSSSDDEVAEIKEESKLVPMTFTATQESNVGTRTALSTGNSVIWKTGDKISVFDAVGDGHNQRFTLTGYATEGIFSGEASSAATQFTAVYPYTSGATLESDGVVNGITLPAEQTATAGSFDPNAALMMAYTTDKSKLDFKNAVSLVKVTTKFACKKIVLSANEDIAGTGTLTMTFDNDTYTSTFTFSSGNSKTITLKPATDGGEIAEGTYYIVVPAITLNDFSISFTASSDNNVYTRKSSQSNTFNRSRIKDLGEFDINGTNWYNPRGDKVSADQEVDLGLTINIGTKNYKVIFAKSNLTAAGLAASEYDYGDYFAWGATEPWYKSYTIDVEYWPTVTSDGWKEGYKNGYESGTAPTFSREYKSGQDFEMSDDPARKILGGDWQLPTKEIWEKLTSSYKWTWNNEISTTRKKGMEVKNESTSKSIFLPAAGFVNEKSFNLVRSNGYYWSGTASAWSSDAYRLHFANNFSPEQSGSYRFFGSSVRPVRLVPVD